MITDLIVDDALQIWTDDDNWVFVNMLDRGVGVAFDEDSFHDFVDALNKARNNFDKHLESK